MPGQAMILAGPDSHDFRSALEQQGWAVLPRLIEPAACRAAAALWGDKAASGAGS